MTNILSKSKLEASLALTAKLLTHSGVNVSMVGSEAKIVTDDNGKVRSVILPVLPEDPSREYLAALHGFLDRKCGEVLYTNHKQIQDLAKSMKHDTNPTYDPDAYNSLLSLVEEVRVSRSMASEYKGSGQNLNEALLQVLEGKDFAPLRKDIKDAIANGQEDQALLQGMFAWLYAQSGNTMAENFLTETNLKPVFENIERAIPNFKNLIADLKSTDDAIALTDKIAQVILEKKEKPPEDENSKGKKQQQSQSGGKGKGKGQSGGKPPPQDEGKPEDEDDDQGGDGEDDKEPEDDEDQDGEGSGKGDEDEDEDDGEDDADGDQDGGDDGSDGDEPDDATESAATGKSEVDLVKSGHFNSLGNSYADLIETGSRKLLSGQKYLAFTTDLDDAEKIEVTKVADTSEISDQIGQIASVVQKNLQRAINARSMQVRQGGFRSGKIQASALHRLSIGDDRVFYKKQETDTKNVAVQLVIDCSGSMGGEKISVAMKSAWVFSEALTKLNIKHEIVGFTTGTQTAKQQAMRNRAEYGSSALQKFLKGLKGGERTTIRTDTIYMPIFKEFVEQFTPIVKTRLASLIDRRGGSGSAKTVQLSSNIDGDSLLMAFKRIIGRKEKRKIMMVFSDGQPAGSAVDVNGGYNYDGLGSHLKSVVEEIEKSGVEVLGIGIQTNCVQNYYPKHVVVSKIGDLTGQTIVQLQKMLLKQ